MSGEMTSTEAIQDLELVARALHETRALLVGLDQVVGALQLLPGPRHDPDGSLRVQHSALRTRLEHALWAADRLRSHLGDRAAESGLL